MLLSWTLPLQYFSTSKRIKKLLSWDLKSGNGDYFSFDKNFQIKCIKWSPLKPLAHCCGERENIYRKITKLLKAIKREPINWAHRFINYALRLKDVHWLHWLHLRYYIMGKHKLCNVTSEPYQSSSRHVSSFVRFVSVLICTYIIYIIYKLYYIYITYIIL